MLRKLNLKRFSWRFTNLQDYPPDPILSIGTMAKEDQNPNKVNLTVGAYRDENGKPWVLPSVHKAIQEIYSSKRNYDIEYLSLKGDQEYVDLATNLIYNYSETGKQLKEEKKIAQLQSLSGTGALYFLLKLYKDCINPSAKVYVPVPSWPIHMTLLHNMGLQCEEILYYNMKTRTFNEEVAKNNLLKIPPKSLAILQVCGHNPTGHDLSIDSWKEVIKYFQENEIDVLVDNPYQGYVSGSIEEDAKATGLFVDSGLNVMFAQSFAKNFGLYSARIGTMSMICESDEKARQVESNLAYAVRNTTSTHPKFGAEVVKTILKNPELTQQWHTDMKTMADRIETSRTSLVEGMEKLGSKRNWNYIKEQRGMFALTDIEKEDVHRLRNEKSVYMIDSGRISISGINQSNVDYLCQSFYDVVG